MTQEEQIVRSPGQETAEPLTFQAATATWVNTRYPVSGKTILEIASDPKLLAAKRYVELGARKVIASNIDRGILSQPLPDHRIETKLIDAREADSIVGAESVDIVAGANILEHLSDIPRALAAIWRALRPGGLCFLHGHPLWTSSRGHHMLLDLGERQYGFSSNSNPIPLWGHLWMSEPEMRRELAVAEHPAEVVEAALAWAFHSDKINRTPRRQIIAALTGGSFRVETLKEDGHEIPDAATITRIRHGGWWHPEEDYRIRQLHCFLRKD